MYLHQHHVFNQHDHRPHGEDVEVQGGPANRQVSWAPLYVTIALSYVVTTTPTNKVNRILPVAITVV